MVMATIGEADYCLLVAEPTLFGTHNLIMVYQLVRLFNKPFGVVSQQVFARRESIGEVLQRTQDPYPDENSL